MQITKRKPSSPLLVIFVFITHLFLFNALAQADTEFTGSLEAQVIDKIHAPAEIKFYFRDENTRSRIPVVFPKKIIEKLRAEPRRFVGKGTRVKISTPAKSLPTPSRLSAMLKTGEPLSISGLESTTNTKALAVQAASLVPSPFGTHKIAAILINVRTPNKTLNSSGTVSSVQSTLFSGALNAKANFEEASYGLFSISGDIFGPYTIDSTNFDCDANLYTWEAAAKAKVTAQGVNLANYDHVVIFFPLYTQLGCAWAGRADMPGTNVAITYNVASTLVHELGHNLGLYHAGLDTNNDGTIAASESYLDYSCQMGSQYNGPTHYNGAHTAQLGWIYSLGSAVREYTARGTYTVTLSALDYNPNTVPNPQLIVLRPPINDNSFYISFRQDMGNYSRLTLAGGFPNKVHIEKFTPSNIFNYSNGIPALGVGGTTYDRHLGYRITVLGITSNTATVKIEIGEPDLDNDGIMDDTDTNDDNDSVLDVNDCAPNDATKWRNQAYPDPDNDGIRNSTQLETTACYGSYAPLFYTALANGPDNCPTVSNADQADSNGNGYGDYCEPRVPSIRGDYNLSGCVDQEDYNFWRANWGKTVPVGTMADGSNNGIVDTGDYVVWRDRKGNGCVSGAAN